MNHEKSPEESYVDKQDRMFNIRARIEGGMYIC